MTYVYAPAGAFIASLHEPCDALATKSFHVLSVCGPLHTNVSWVLKKYFLDGVGGTYTYWQGRQSCKQWRGDRRAGTHMYVLMTADRALCSYGGL